MQLGYNTNGLAHHRFEDALALLADNGYTCVAITPDINWLDPYQPAPALLAQIRHSAQLLDRYGMHSVMESGARFLINPRKKHDPTLMDAQPDRRQLRLDYLQRLFHMAADLGSSCLSFWSGRLDEPIPQAQADSRLATAINQLLTLADQLRIPIAFEPEPGMYIQSLDDFHRLDSLIPPTPHFQLTIDLGHLHCLNEHPIADKILAFAPRIRNIHIEDMLPNIHEHLMFGSGNMQFEPIFTALHSIGYTGPLCVELSRDSHRADFAVPASAHFLNQFLPA